ncbi:hypothetical protein GLOIN_2v1886362 [Rhizophagus clarus]|uniref:Uncharacterized protein n=1 Tax=Rhizophagus clarus TaxID=94130 RepID=A0A8H3M610_9GLOM|nr:hypothetical protein GLOIN_2v1886362 [Rhizophagus clarus]
MKILPKVSLNLLTYQTCISISTCCNGTTNKLQECRARLVKATRYQMNKNRKENEEAISSPLLLSFMDIGQKSALIYSQMGWYELATYTMEESDGVFSKVHLHIGDVVTIHEEDSGECYAIIKGIFKYKGNDDKYYAFITIDWFDNINRIHNVFEMSSFSHSDKPRHSLEKNLPDINN